jgi:hypothetical protein
MGFPSTLCVIFTPGETKIGRAMNEINDLEPKKILVNTNDPDPVWGVEKLSDDSDHHYLYAKNAPTASDNGGVFALMIEQERKTKWRLEQRSNGLIRYLRH